MNYLKNLSITINSFHLLLSCLFCLSFLTSCNSGSSSDTLTLAPNSAESAESAEFTINLPAGITVKAGDIVELTPEINGESTTIVTYQWKQTSGSAVTLTTNDRLYLEFTAPVNDNLTFEVVATDSDGIQYTDTINITVLPADEILNSILISWNAPILNTDGSELSNLVGYKIYYGQDQAQLDKTILVSDVGLTSYTIDDLPSGINYFFCVTAINSAGYESQKSEMVEYIL
ncbi:MAG: hypothetical protein ACJAZP_001539 [Psychromonas sp.]|jgi:hypothetical protein|uniref:fibronectin type III domain-containing protein n=1 Tax=Psychromonas sp. TaxID=1884585 RepID=UPI0039E2AA46